MNTNRQPELMDQSPAVSVQGAVLMLAAAAAGALAAVLILPAWIPGMGASLLSEKPQAFWFLARSSAMVAYALLWLSMAFGLLITNRMARLWPGGPVAFDLHQHASLLGLAFGLFHGLILLGDRYINFSLSQVLLPFSAISYRPFSVGLGQVAFYMMAVVSLSFYVRRKISRQTWRLIHFASFSAYLMALAHGILAGTDAAAWWAEAAYWLSGGVLLFLFTARILGVMLRSANPARQSVSGPNP